MSNFEIAISFFLVALWLVLFFSGAFKGEYNPQESGWLSNESPHPIRQSYDNDENNDWQQGKKANNAPAEESETPMQKFRRENSMSECVRRGGYLTTGERMEAMYGACEETAMCFPDEYYPSSDEN